ncbi:MAG: 5-formyltetrahydrofolate cyclo-ligase [Flavobacteriaceae bacterium]|nr:MAG: 5-formyltetrahydrofolate cyclo-ligase [Flavobacteriaceae bacterium]
MFKKELRLNYIQLRNKVSSKELQDSSIQIANKLLELPIWSLNFYHIFLTISEKKEIDTSFILSILQGKDKNVVLPKMTGEHTLANYLLTDSLIIKKNKWNIPEPVNGIEISSKQIDVVFIPLLAYDSIGNRVGYGKGYYDVFLKKCAPDVIKIGLSLFRPEDEISDTNANDIALDYCVTPEQVYKF